jgi:hypothetical protein
MYRALNLSHRRLIGASTLTRRKKGRRRRISRIFSSQISVVTHRSCHLEVTKSSNSSALWKVGPSFGDLSCGTWEFEALRSTAGGGEARSRCTRVKLCSLTRYEAIEDLPAAMPFCLN